MKDVITSILTDTNTRNDAAIESVAVQQAVAVPWWSVA